MLVVGSGASGGWACKRLAESGIKVALIDAGRLQSDKNFTEHMPGFQLKYRDMAREVIRKTRPRQAECYACTEYNYLWFCNDLEEPYTTPTDMPFSWQGRMRVTGGRTNTWARQSYRFSDLDFKAASHDGYGQDWPLSYKDLAPYYSLVESYVGITGIPEGVYELPDGEFHPPHGADVRRDAVPQSREGEVGVDGDPGSLGEHHQADQRPGALPLLWAV